MIVFDVVDTSFNRKKGSSSVTSSSVSCSIKRDDLFGRFDGLDGFCDGVDVEGLCGQYFNSVRKQERMFLAHK